MNVQTQSMGPLRHTDRMVYCARKKRSGNRRACHFGLGHALSAPGSFETSPLALESKSEESGLRRTQDHAKLGGTDEESL